MEGGFAGEPDFTRMAIEKVSWIGVGGENMLARGGKGVEETVDVARDGGAPALEGQVGFQCIDIALGVLQVGA